MREIKFRVFDYETKGMLDNLSLHEDWKSIEKRNCVKMQFTGLEDKNGREIYEGDILKDELGRLVKIEYENNKFCLFPVHPSYFFKAGSQDFLLQENNLEIIGNIYENEDLLK